MQLLNFALSAASEAAFRELRRRILAVQAGDRVVTDMGALLIFSFADPDGGNREVVWRKPGIPEAASLKRADWTTVNLDQ